MPNRKAEIKKNLKKVKMSGPLTSGPGPMPREPRFGRPNTKASYGPMPMGKGPAGFTGKPQRKPRGFKYL